MFFLFYLCSTIFVHKGKKSIRCSETLNILQISTHQKGKRNHRYTANVLLVDSTDFVSVPNPTVVQAWFPLILTTYLTMRNTAKATYFYRCIKELIMHIS